MFLDNGLFFLVRFKREGVVVVDSSGFFSLGDGFFVSLDKSGLQVGDLNLVFSLEFKSSDGIVDAVNSGSSFDLDLFALFDSVLVFLLVVILLFLNLVKSSVFTLKILGVSGNGGLGLGNLVFNDSVLLGNTLKSLEFTFSSVEGSLSSSNSSLVTSDGLLNDGGVLGVEVFELNLVFAALVVLRDLLLGDPFLSVDDFNISDSLDGFLNGVFSFFGFNLLNLKDIVHLLNSLFEDLDFSLDSDDSGLGGSKNGFLLSDLGGDLVVFNLRSLLFLDVGVGNLVLDAFSLSNEFLDQFFHRSDFFFVFLDFGGTLGD